MKTIVIYSSSNPNGNTYQSAKALAEEKSAELIYLDRYKIGEYCYKHSHSDDDFINLFRWVLGFDHIIFASPVYWYAVTPRMKAFVDRITDFMDIEALKPELRALREKHFSILSTSCQAQAPAPFTEMLVGTFEYLGMTLQEQRHVHYPYAD
ncbi:flavodoxin family protein [Pseudoalteromonas sp. McH1-7]|uniref:NADPH-dependent FMN reductase-like domain-containing protein n=1 Tax=Pseudoalteromonas peptidolytica F12-50-A1 TaxID=1315280 RepID=A0A8I0T394_9GAMM|nr:MULTISPECIES: flavodoxin family protein [Pseudoalteromonas]MBE0346141.1 hypothetical protein [Pseudoalteromonas peptidolytica F12-50-A1]MDW7548225.1 flavodoxin family protein [Pseudoalteromonas peptidolytica]NLR16140.1 flavodoxin family protein [Pseudoalteromonas peptidolytica]NUZ10326.1 flavodoxin family protein [Pseudoalteromonas sp. McH1-7]RRS07152.1 flavodoxin family protein [Pseudoalteromonas sp. J010]